jgi:DUF1009 family protein
LFRWNKIIYMNKWWKSEKTVTRVVMLGIIHKKREVKDLIQHFKYNRYLLFIQIKNEK